MTLPRGCLQLAFQIGHVVVFVAIARSFAQADAIDDRRVVQRVGNDGIAFIEQRFEHAAVGIERRRIENSVFHAEEAGERLFKLFVHRLRATNETDG